MISTIKNVYVCGGWWLRGLDEVPGNFKVGDVSVRVREWGGGGGGVLAEITHVCIPDDPMSSVNCTIITKWYFYLTFTSLSSGEKIANFLQLQQITTVQHRSLHKVPITVVWTEAAWNEFA